MKKVKRKVQVQAERPLDDGARDGTEIWRTVEGIDFCHWDRWLLRLAHSEPGGLEVLTRIFRERRKKKWTVSDPAEAMLAQIADLQARLQRLGRTPENLLDGEERASQWLFKKATKRVLQDGPHRRTVAMRNTPRRRLEQRALRGHWSSFPVSPSRFEDALRRIAGTGGHLHWAMTGAVAGRLEIAIDFLLGSTSSALERLAVHRAAMTVVLETIAHADDSMGDLGELFAQSERAYFPLLHEITGHDILLRDLLELSIWESYGLFRDVEPFVASLRDARADRAMRQLATIMTELRREDLDCQLAKARALRSALLKSAVVLLPDEE